MRDKVRSHGRPAITYGINALVLVADTDAEAESLAREHLHAVQHDPSIHVGASGMGANLIGSPKTVVERIKRYQSMGIDLFMLYFHPMRDGL